jgi:hypothetical protein
MVRDCTVETTSFLWQDGVANFLPGQEILVASLGLLVRGRGMSGLQELPAERRREPWHAGRQLLPAYRRSFRNFAFSSERCDRLPEPLDPAARIPGNHTTRSGWIPPGGFPEHRDCHGEEGYPNEGRPILIPMLGPYVGVLRCRLSAIALQQRHNREVHAPTRALPRLPPDGAEQPTFPAPSYTRFVSTCNIQASKPSRNEGVYEGLRSRHAAAEEAPPLRRLREPR